MDDVARIIDGAGNLGPWAVVGIVALVVGVVVLRRIQLQAEARRELENAEADYRKAVASRDTDRIRVARRRLQECRARAGLKA